MKQNPLLVNASDPAEDIAEVIHALRHLYRTHHFRAVGDGPLKIAPMEARALNFIARRPGTTQTALVAHWARDKGQVARLIQSLKDRDFLSTAPLETDRRVQCLTLTSQGEAAHRAVQDHRRAIAQRAVEGLARAEQAVLLDLLGRVRDNFG